MFLLAIFLFLTASLVSCERWNPNVNSSTCMEVGVFESFSTGEYYSTSGWFSGYSWVFFSVIGTISDSNTCYTIIGGVEGSYPCHGFCEGYQQAADNINIGIWIPDSVTSFKVDTTGKCTNKGSTGVIIHRRCL